MNKKLIFAILGVCLLTVGALALLWGTSRSRSEKSVKATGDKHAHAPTPPVKENKPAPRIPAYQSEAATLAPTLSPEMFSGPARTAYTIAREIPGTLAQLPCYCHCDKSIGHKSLHTCFVDDHASACGVCINTAIAAYKYEKELNLTPPQIRERVIAEFGQKRH